MTTKEVLPVTVIGQMGCKECSQNYHPETLHVSTMLAKLHPFTQWQAFPGVLSLAGLYK